MNILVDGQTLESAELNRGIGIYFKNVLNSMVKLSYQDQWYITLSRKASVHVLDPWVMKRVKILIDPIFEPCTDYSRTRNYTDQLKEFVKQHQIDAMWTPNPLMMNVLFPAEGIGCPLFVTIHDLIPAVMPVKEWSNHVRNEYKRRLLLLGSLPEAHLICISQATRRDVYQYIGKDVKTHVVLEAANSRLFYRERYQGGISEQPKIVFTGGFDYRKNMDGAIKAFAEARNRYPQDIRVQAAHLYIVCSCPPEQKAAFEQQLNELHIGQHVTLTGFIPDEELAALYAKADLFFFPSLYEGFGLPLLEAMLGGAYILSADNSSLPEVCGPHAIFCKANNIVDMADKLQQALLASSCETAEQKRKRQAYALGFSWEETALQTLQALQEAMCNNVTHERLKIAVVTPWPPQKTGIANYVYKMMPFWAKYFDVDIFTEAVKQKSKIIKNQYGNLFPLSKLKELYSFYDHVLYQLGNSTEYHKSIYELFCLIPDIAEIHDFVLHPFFYHSYFLKGDFKAYQRALEIGYKENGLAHFEHVKNKQCPPDERRFPMSKTVTNQSSATIFHNNWSCEQFDNTPVYVVPHPCFEKEDLAKDEKEILMQKMKKRIGWRETESIIACFGYINANKRPEVVLKAIKELLNTGKKVRMVFFGENNLPDLRERLKEMKLLDTVAITGYLEKGEYEASLEISDIIVNLRHPSMGESSGTLCEAMKYGKPIIVTESNQYCEYPDEVCWKVPVGEQESKLLAAMLTYLLEHPQVMRALGNNAQSYADYVLSPAKIAMRYFEILSRIEGKKKVAACNE